MTGSTVTILYHITYIYTCIYVHRYILPGIGPTTVSHYYNSILKIEARYWTLKSLNNCMSRMLSTASVSSIRQTWELLPLDNTHELTNVLCISIIFSAVLSRTAGAITRII